MSWDSTSDFSSAIVQHPRAQAPSHPHRRWPWSCVSVFERGRPALQLLPPASPLPLPSFGHSARPVGCYLLFAMLCFLLLPPPGRTHPTTHPATVAQRPCCCCSLLSCPCPGPVSSPCFPVVDPPALLQLLCCFLTLTLARIGGAAPCVYAYTPNSLRVT